MRVMPTYEYGCEACGQQWEMEQRISADPIKKCPHCGKRKAKRLVSGGSGVIFKGGGWYADLYHKPAGSSDRGSSDRGSSDRGSSDGGSSDGASSGKGSSSDSSSASTSESKPKKSKAKKAKD